MVHLQDFFSSHFLCHGLHSVMSLPVSPSGAGISAYPGWAVSACFALIHKGPTN